MDDAIYTTCKIKMKVNVLQLNFHNQTHYYF